MSRTPARVTQADLARSIRAAKQAGAGGVELRPDGTIFIHMTPPEAKNDPETEKELEPHERAPL
jgi:hypothetical protein